MGPGKADTYQKVVGADGNFRLWDRETLLPDHVRVEAHRVGCFACHAESRGAAKSVNIFQSFDGSFAAL